LLIRSTLEPTDGAFNWTLLDAVFAAAEKTNKGVILGLQAGVCAPAWLLKTPEVATVRFVHRNPGWYSWATMQSHVRRTLHSTWHRIAPVRPSHASLHTAREAS